MDPIMAEDSEECLAQVRAALAAKEMEALEVIKEDLCQWLTNTLQSVVSPLGFMGTLETGVVLCKLAEIVQQLSAKGKAEGRHGGSKFQVPMEPLNCNHNAGPGTLGVFHSRVNTSNFISWCRQLGVEEAVIFESEGLVLHKDEKRVILCLLDVARFAERVGLPPPQLVCMEREIDLLEEGGSGDEPAQPVITTPQDAGTLTQTNLVIPLGDLCKIEGTGDSFNHTHNNKECSPTAHPFVSRIPVRSPKSSIKYRKSPTLQNAAGSLAYKSDTRKRWRSEEREVRIGMEEGKEKESEGAELGDVGESVGSPGKRQRVGSRGSLGGRVSRGSIGGRKEERKGVEVESKGTVEERVMKRVEECTCQNKIVVVSLGKGKFTVKGSSGRTMTVYARILSDRLMVRIGGGWDTLDHFLLKHDPCRLHAMASKYACGAIQDGVKAA